MNAERYTGSFKKIILIFVDLRKQPSLDFDNFFDFQEMENKLSPKLNQVCWTGFIYFRTVRKTSTQLPIGFEIANTAKQTSVFYFYLSH